MRTTTLMLLLAALALVSCRKQDSSELPPDASIYQDYKVLFDKPDNRTRAFATFRLNNSWGTRLELTGGSSITFNGNSFTTYTELDNYFYRWSTSGIVDVDFLFTKAGGAWFANRIHRTDTIDVEVPNGVTLSRTNGGQVFWLGRPLEEGERLEAWLRQNNSNTSKTTVTTNGAQAVTIPSSVTSGLSAGTAQLYLNRSRTLQLNEGDANAGGRRIVEVEARGTVTIE